MTAWGYGADSPSSDVPGNKASCDGTIHPELWKKQTKMSNCQINSSPGGTH